MSGSGSHVLRSRLDEIGMGDPVFTSELIDVMLEDGLIRVQRLREAYEADQLEDVGRLAHSLKGAALNIGALPLAALCASVDDSVRKLKETIGRDRVEDIEREFNEVAQALTRIKQELAE